MIRYCESFGYGGTTLSQHISNNLTHITVPAEDRSQLSTTFTHALRGSSTCAPPHAPSGQYFHTHFNVLQPKHKQPNFKNKKEGIHKA
jgi:hypothetical protein